MSRKIIEGLGKLCKQEIADQGLDSWVDVLELIVQGVYRVASKVVPKLEVEDDGYYVVYWLIILLFISLIR